MSQVTLVRASVLAVCLVDQHSGLPEPTITSQTVNSWQPSLCGICSIIWNEKKIKFDLKWPVLVNYERRFLKIRVTISISVTHSKFGGLVPL